MVILAVLSALIAGTYVAYVVSYKVKSFLAALLVTPIATIFAALFGGMIFGYIGGGSLLAAIPALVVGFSVGRLVLVGERTEQVELNEVVSSMGQEELLEEVEKFLSQPQVAPVPWVQNSWINKPRQEKLDWIDRFQDRIKECIAVDLDADEYIVELQRLDRQLNA